MPKKKAARKTANVTTAEAEEQHVAEAEDQHGVLGHTDKLKPGDALPQDVVELFEKHLKYLAAGRANYGKADKLLDQILQRCEPGCEHVAEAVGKKPPQRMTIVDKFADTNQVWAGSSCKRIAIEVKAIKPQDR